MKYNFYTLERFVMALEMFSIPMERILVALELFSIPLEYYSRGMEKGYLHIKSIKTADLDNQKHPLKTFLSITHYAKKLLTITFVGNLNV